MNWLTKKNRNLCKFDEPLKLQHLAIIMDGNGRWAQQKGRPRYFGHFRGVQALKSVVQRCSALGVPYLSVFAFSTENWKRSEKEIYVIMKLINRSLNRYQQLLKNQNVRIHVLGDLQQLPVSLQEAFTKAVESTKNNTGLNFIIAVNYGGRREIVQAFHSIAKKIKDGLLQISEVTEDCISRYLPSSVFPPPNLIIRTGAVSRLSNFYLWNSAYSELYVSSALWPDFNDDELCKALKFYRNTQRRFGAVPNEKMEK